MDFTDCHKSIRVRNLVVNSSDLICAATETNYYIEQLTQILNDLGFDIFVSLGQRNISGFIGEIFKNMLANRLDGLITNPHPDGRPDILAVETDEIKRYYSICFETINGSSVPIKDMLTPFRYGGIEIKCSIGSTSKSLSDRYYQLYGHGFDLYDPRVGFVDGITWWAHHNSATNLLGLYYDYYAAKHGIPQIISGFYAELLPEDWNSVSIVSGQ